MTAYYNEFDPYAAQWLRNLIAAGHIAPGFVDERSIEDVKPWELFGYTQCHFFAGIGVWSLALRRSGWPDDRPVWTASCPCQPFSAAGQGAGFNDERHLWPAFYHLASQLRPAVVLGEQVASKDAEPWIDLVQSDVETLGYAFGCVAFPSASVGAPHIRDRSYWVAHADHDEYQREVGGRAGQASCGSVSHRTGVLVAGELGGASQYVPDGLGDNNNTGLERLGGGHQTTVRRQGEIRPATEAGKPSHTSPTNGLWRDVDWLYCRDGKWRPVEPGTFPLVNGASARVGRLRPAQEAGAEIQDEKPQASRIGRLKGYGNAVNVEAARIFIESVNEVIK